MAAPVLELGKQFAASKGMPVEYDLGGSETLLPKILAGAPADIFVCHDPFEEKLKTAGRWTNTVVVGYLEPVVAVHPGNPKNLRRLADLARPDLQLGIGDPRYSTCGELFVRALREQGLYDAVMKNVKLQARSHGEIANGLVLGPLDAVVVWNFVVQLYPGKLEVAPSGVKYPVTRVTVLGLAGSPNPAGRDAILEWFRQPAAQAAFRKHGYGREQE
jgi:molybdate transport system substrate-binding protein